MESLVNYESDDGNSKSSKKHSSRNTSKNKEKRRSSSDDDDSSDDSRSPVIERSRKSNNEDDKKSKRRSSSPRKSSKKSSRSDKHRSNESRVDKHRRRSSSRDSDIYEQKKRKNEERDDRRKNEERDDRRKYQQRSRDLEKRSESRDKDEHSNRDRHRDRNNGHRRRSKEHDKRSESRDKDDRSSKDRHRDRSNEQRKDRYDDRNRHNRREGDRRYDDKRDYGQRRDESAHHSSIRTSSDDRGNSSVPNTLSAIRRAEALNRTIERRANEKVQQLQKLGIEIPGLMQQHQQFKSQNHQIQPLMSIGTITGGAAPISTTNDESNAETDANLALNLSNFTSPVLTNARYTEQMQKKKLIWGAKKAATVAEAPATNNKWEAAKFSQDSDGKMASKFLRLMGMKNVPSTTSSASEEDVETSVQKREQMFSTMEQQYEIARQATHTMRGMGLGFGSQSRPC